LQQAVLERQKFRGYSGRARMISGGVALVTATVMSLPFYPDRPLAHIMGWAGVFVVAMILNLVAVASWFLRDPTFGRDIRVLRPIIDVVPPILVGGLLTAAMLLNGHFEYLFGIWMCLFGLTNTASRMVLPKWILGVGVFYMIAGAICLLAPAIEFTNPWPMGVVFFAGEWVGGMILHYDGTRNVDSAVGRIGNEAL